MKKLLLLSFIICLSCSKFDDQDQCALDVIEIRENYSELIFKAEGIQQQILIRNMENEINKLNCY